MVGVPSVAAVAFVASVPPQEPSFAGNLPEIHGDNRWELIVNNEITLNELAEFLRTTDVGIHLDLVDGVDHGVVPFGAANVEVFGDGSVTLRSTDRVINGVPGSLPTVVGTYALHELQDAINAEDLEFSIDKDALTVTVKYSHIDEAMEILDLFPESGKIHAVFIAGTEADVLLEDPGFTRPFRGDSNTGEQTILVQTLKGNEIETLFDNFDAAVSAIPDIPEGDTSWSDANTMIVDLGRRIVEARDDMHWLAVQLRITLTHAAGVFSNRNINWWIRARDFRLLTENVFVADEIPDGFNRAIQATGRADIDTESSHTRMIALTRFTVGENDGLKLGFAGHPSNARPISDIRVRAELHPDISELRLSARAESGAGVGPISMVAFWGEGQTEEVGGAIVRELTSLSRYRWEFDQGEPNDIIFGTDPGVRAVNASFAANADLLGAEVLGDRRVLQFPSGRYLIDAFQVTRANVDDDLRAAAYRVMTGDDDHLVEEASGYNSNTSADPLGVVGGTGNLGQTIRFPVFTFAVPDGETGQLTFITGGLEIEPDRTLASGIEKDSAFRVFVTKVA